MKLSIKRTAKVAKTTPAHRGQTRSQRQITKLAHDIVRKDITHKVANGAAITTEAAGLATGAAMVIGTPVVLATSTGTALVTGAAAVTEAGLIGAGSALGATTLAAAAPAVIAAAPFVAPFAVLAGIYLVHRSLVDHAAQVAGAGFVAGSKIRDLVDFELDEFEETLLVEYLAASAQDQELTIEEFLTALDAKITAAQAVLAEDDAFTEAMAKGHRVQPEVQTEDHRDAQAN